MEEQNGNFIKVDIIENEQNPLGIIYSTEQKNSII